MSKTIIASGPVIVEDGKVLVNKYGDTSFWKFCGGRMETDDQTLQEVAKREVKEEMGIDIEIISPEPFLVYTTKETIEGMIDIILVHYLAKRIGDINPGDDVREWKWLDLKDLESEDLAPNIIPALKHFNFL